MGKGGGGSTTVQTQEVPGFVKDMVTESFGIAKNFRPNPNTVAGVARFTPDQLAYQQSLKNFAQNTPLGTAIAEQTFRDVARSQQIDQGNLQNLLGQNVQFDNPLAGGSGINTDILQGLTQARTTPFLQQQLDTAIQGAVDQATSQYALGGRLGSDSFADALGGGVASAAAPILNQAAQQDAANQLQAAQALANAQQASGALSLQGATAAADIEQRNLQNQLQTAQALADAQQTETAQALQAASQLPQFQGLQLQRIAALGDIGQQQQSLLQSQFNQQAQKVAAQNQAQQQRINNILAAVGGSPVPMTTTSDVTKQVSTGDQIAGTVATLAALASLSDRRFKSKIAKLGTHSTGLNVYEWEWNAKAIVLGLDKYPNKGFMAQEVQHVFPEAVFKDKNGYLMIDYSKIKEVA